MANILLVDDEPIVLDILVGWCQDAHHTVVTAVDGREGLRMFFLHHPDLVVTDIRMPEMNGFEMVSRIREVSHVPIIALSALGQEQDIVRGLRTGADDYVVKPIGMQHLLARIEASLRRAQLPPMDGRCIYSDGLLTIHLDRQEAYLRDRKLDLTPKELKLLVCLTERAGRVVSVPQILNEVWGSLYYSEESVKWHIASLRRKLSVHPNGARLITTVWGSGYRYDKPTLPFMADTPDPDLATPASVVPPK